MCVCVCVCVCACERERERGVGVVVGERNEVIATKCSMLGLVIDSLKK